MDVGKLLLIAGGAVAGALAAQQARAHHDTSKKPRRRVPGGRAAARHHQRNGIAASAALEPTQLEAHPLGAAVAAAPAPVLGRAAYVALLLQSLLSCAAVLHAEHLRPPAYSPLEWQQLVAAASVALCTLCLAAAALAAFLNARRAAAAVPAAVPAAAGARAGEHAGAGALPQRRGPRAQLQDLDGVWLKDGGASDSMDPACDAMRLGGLVRTAIRLIKGLEVRVDPDGQQFRMSVLSGILWFKVTEQYPLDGRAVQWRRRDLRRGKHTGWAARCPSTGGVVLTMEWGEPCGGWGQDLFALVAPDELHVRTTLRISGQDVAYTQVYRRKGS